MRSRLLLVGLLVLTTACTKKDDTAAKPDSSSGNVAAKTELSAAEIAAAKKKAAEEAELLEAARIKAESEAAAKRLADATEKYNALNDELNAAMKNYTAASRNAKTRAERAKLARENPIITLGPRFVNFANEYAGTKEAVEATAMLATRGSGDTKTEAIGVLIKDYPNHDKVVDIVSTIKKSRGMPSPQNEKWIDQIIANTTTPKIEGNALAAKAELLDKVTTYKGHFASATEKQLENVNKEVLEYVNAERDANELKELEKLMEAFVKDHAAEASIVERELFGLKYLGINCEAPDIAGIDLDDKDFKLSDYRGKVVLLDFWGDW